ncbi:MAG: hypothetical protein ABJE66_00685 [Deltaproteobacteria bacterium]
MPTLFLLSPARCGGVRAGQLARSRGELGTRLRAGTAQLGDVFAWLSALYFRGKLAYARTFADPSPGAASALVMAPGLGLHPPETTISVAHLRAMGSIEVESEAFVTALRTDAVEINAELRADTQVVLLGSIASGKYVDTLIDVFGARLVFPAEFVGRGDMSRGGMMLRASRSGEPLAYAMVAGAVRRGKRPPKLGPVKGKVPRK